jgi:hypothetical protein
MGAGFASSCAFETSGRQPGPQPQVLLLFFALKLRSTGGIALNLLLNSF